MKFKYQIPAKITCITIYLLLFYVLSGMTQQLYPLGVQPLDTVLKKNEIQFYLKNPSTWIQNRINKLNTLILPFQPRLDTAGIERRIRSIYASGELIRENLAENSGSLRLRYISELKDELNTNIDLLFEMQNNMQKHNIFLTNKTLVSVSIAKEVEYFRAHSDSTVRAVYRNEINKLSTKLEQTDSILSSNLSNLVVLEASVNSVAFRLQDISKFAYDLGILKGESLTRANFPPIWKTKPSDYHESKINIMQTLKRAMESINFFFTYGNALLVFIRLLVLLLCIYPLYYLYTKSPGDFNTIKPMRYMDKYPVIATLILLLTVFPYLLVHSPVILVDSIAIVQIIAITFLVLKKYQFISKKSLFFLVAFFFILKMLNLAMAPTFLSRIFLAAAIIVMVPMYQIYRDFASHKQSKTRIYSAIALFLTIQMAIGWLLSLFGFLGLGRTWFISALDSFLLAVCLYVAVRTLLDYLGILTVLINKKLKTFYIHEEIVEKYIGNALVVTAIFTLGVSMLKNINFYYLLETSLSEWFNQSRSLGQSVFSYYSIFLFVAYLSGFILIANFFNKVIDTNDNQQIYKRRTSLGSFMLLFRFAMIMIGFILAIMASGIPMTQLTVLIGALGVGIGFGLQNIFNNLVSGLIIAIEKPISVGDMIEVGTNTGWVKGIGIRSSNIQSFDGAEIIVPNGEIIANRITNWTLSDKKRRLEIIIGVAYRSDPHQVYSLLYKVVEENSEILKNPEPFIVFTGMGEHSLNFKIQFWIADYVEGIRIKSEVLLMIFDKLRENEIEIPFPQRDLHLKSVHPDLMKQIGTNGD